MTPLHRIRELIESAEAMAAYSRGEYSVRVAAETAAALRELVAIREAQTKEDAR